MARAARSRLLYNDSFFPPDLWTQNTWRKKREQRKEEENTAEGKGCGSSSKPSITKVTFGREKKKMGQTAPARSCCTSQTVGKMTGLNKNASDNKKEISKVFPCLKDELLEALTSLPVSVRSRNWHPPTIMINDALAGDTFLTALSLERSGTQLRVVCWVIALAKKMFVRATETDFNSHLLLILCCDILSWKNRKTSTKNIRLRRIKHEINF